MRLPFAALAAAVAAEWLILDSSFSHWEDEWEFVAQTGADTGNNELQDYKPSQCQQRVNGDLALLLQRSADGRFAVVSVTFSGLSSPQTVAYLRYGSTGEVGTELLRLPNGQVSGVSWVFTGSGTLSAADMVKAIQLHATPGLRLIDRLSLGAASGHGHIQNCSHRLQRRHWCEVACS